MATGYIAGIDGGASKTAAVLTDRQGRVLASCRMPGIALLGPPTPAQADTLRTLADELCRLAGIGRDDVSCWGLGMNGVDFADEFAEQRAAIGQALRVEAARVELVNDGIVALWGASAAPAAVILQLGSGITTAYRDRLGGEQIFDCLNVGRITDLRQTVIQRVARMIDGRCPRTPLCAQVLAHLEVGDPEHFAELVFRRRLNEERLRGLLALVFGSWQAGDPAAGELVSAALDDYAGILQVMARRTAAADPDLTCGGGVISQAPPAFWSALELRLRQALPQARLKPVAMAPELGAVVMAHFRCGGDANGLFHQLSGKNCVRHA